MITFRYFILGISAFLLVAYIIFGMSVDLTPVSFIFVIMANIYMVFCSRNNFLLFIVSFIIFYCNYSIIYANYTGLISNMYTSYLSEESFVISLNVLTLFNLLIFLFVRWERILPGPRHNIFVEDEKKDSLILYMLYVLLTLIFFVGFKVPEIEGQRGEASAIYEYSAILFIIFFFYCGGQKKHIKVGLLLVALFSIQSFIFGGRIDAIQFLLVSYIMVFMYRVSMTKVLVGMVFMFVFLSIVGVVRGELLSGNTDVGAIMTSLVESGFALDTAYSAYYTSESFVYIIDKYSFAEILRLFVEFVKSIFLSSNPDMLLTSISSHYVFHYGGGILPFYFFFYLGMLGIVAASALVAFYLNIVIKLSVVSSGYIKCLAVWTICTTFRWYLYSPIQLLRGVLILTIVYFGFAYVHYQLNRLPIFNKRLVSGES